MVVSCSCFQQYLPRHNSTSHQSPLSPHNSILLSSLFSIIQSYTDSNCPKCTQQYQKQPGHDQKLSKLHAAQHLHEFRTNLCSSIFGWTLTSTIISPHTSQLIHHILSVLIETEANAVKLGLPFDISTPQPLNSPLFASPTQPSQQPPQGITPINTLPFDLHQQVVSSIVALGILFLQLFQTSLSSYFNFLLEPSSTISSINNQPFIQTTELITWLERLDSSVKSTPNEESASSDPSSPRSQPDLSASTRTTPELNKVNNYANILSTLISSLLSPSHISTITQSPIFTATSLTMHPFFHQFQTILIELFLAVKSLSSTFLPLTVTDIDDLLFTPEQSPKTSSKDENGKTTDEPLLVSSFRLEQVNKAKKQQRITVLQPIPPVDLQDDANDNLERNLHFLTQSAHQYTYLPSKPHNKAKPTADLMNNIETMTIPEDTEVPDPLQPFPRFSFAYQPEHLINAKEYEQYQTAEQDKKAIRTVTPTLPQYPWEQSLLLGVPHNLMTITISFRRLIVSITQFISQGANINQQRGELCEDISQHIINHFLSNSLSISPSSTFQQLQLIHQTQLIKSYSTFHLIPYVNATLGSFHFLSHFIRFLFASHHILSNTHPLSHPISNTSIQASLLLKTYRILHPIIKLYDLKVGVTENPSFVEPPAVHEIISRIQALTQAQISPVDSKGANVDYYQLQHLLQSTLVPEPAHDQRDISTLFRNLQASSPSSSSSPSSTKPTLLPTLASLSRSIHYIKCTKMQCECPVYSHLHLERIYHYENSAKNRSREANFASFYEQSENNRFNEAGFARIHSQHPPLSTSSPREQFQTIGKSQLCDDQDSPTRREELQNQKEVESQQQQRPSPPCEPDQQQHLSSPGNTSDLRGLTTPTEQQQSDTLEIDLKPLRDSPFSSPSPPPPLPRPPTQPISPLHSLYASMTSSSSSNPQRFPFCYSQLVSPYCTAHHIQTISTKQNDTTAIQSLSTKELESKKQQLILESPNKNLINLSTEAQHAYLDAFFQQQHQEKFLQNSVFFFITGLGQFYAPFFSLLSLYPALFNAVGFLRDIQSAILTPRRSKRQEMLFRVMLKYLCGDIRSVYAIIYTPTSTSYLNAVKTFQHDIFHDIHHISLLAVARTHHSTPSLDISTIFPSHLQTTLSFNANTYPPQHLTINPNVVEAFRKLLFHAPQAILIKSHCLPAIHNVISYYISTIFTHSIFPPFLNAILTPTNSFLTLFHTSKRSKLQALHLWEKEQQYQAEAFKGSLHEQDMQQWNEYILGLAEKHEKDLQDQRDRERSKTLQSFRKQRDLQQKERMHQNKDKILQDSRELLQTVVAGGSSHNIPSTHHGNSVNDSMVESEPAPSQKRGVVKYSAQKVTPSLNSSSKLSPTQSQSKLQAYSGSKAKEGKTDQISRKSQSDARGLSLVLRFPRCLTAEEKIWIKEQQRREKERKAIHATQPVFHFEHEGFEVHINQGNMIDSDGEGGDSDGDNVDQDDDVQVYANWGVNGCDGGESASSISTQELIQRLLAGGTIDDITTKGGNKRQDHQRRNQQDLTQLFKHIQQHNQQNDPFAFDNIHKFVFVRLQANPVPIDLASVSDGKELQQITTISPIQKEFPFSLDIFRKSASEGNSMSKDDDHFYTWSLTILPLNEVKTLLDVHKKLEDKYQQLQKYADSDASTESAQELRTQMHTTVYHNMHYLGLVNIDEIAPPFFLTIQRAIPKHHLFGLHPDVHLYSQLFGPNTAANPHATALTNIPNSSIPLSAHFKDDDNEHFARFIRNQNDIDDHIDTRNNPSSDHDNDLDEGLDTELLYKILMDTQTELHAAGAFDQEDLEEEISKLRF